MTKYPFYVSDVARPCRKGGVCTLGHSNSAQFDFRMQRIPEQIHRDRWRMKLGRAEWKVGNCPDVLLELTGEAALDAVMAELCEVPSH